MFMEVHQPYNVTKEFNGGSKELHCSMSFKLFYEDDKLIIILVNSINFIFIDI